MLLIFDGRMICLLDVVFQLWSLSSDSREQGKGRAHIEMTEFCARKTASFSHNSY